MQETLSVSKPSSKQSQVPRGEKQTKMELYAGPGDGSFSSLTDPGKLKLSLKNSVGSKRETPEIPSILR